MRRFQIMLFLIFGVLLFGCGNDSSSSDGSGSGICQSNCASSGACSGHGGVNCAAGPDSDGSVICNDGWRDSSVQYHCY